VIDAPALERLLKRDRAITLAGLAALCVLAWAYVVEGAGLGMSAWKMTTLSLFPHLQAAPGMNGMVMARASWAPLTWVLMLAMWWVMMIAMMVPSAVPAILLFARVHRHALERAQIQGTLGPTAAFTAGYLCVWLAFAAAATVLNWLLHQTGLVSAMMMGSQSRWLSGAVLIVAGLYQLSLLKRACLSHCRSPASFLARHWRPQATGALRLGTLHGAYCVGCCWMLMMILFVMGAMNLVWIAALAVLVLIEKVLPIGRWAGRGAGGALIAWGIATLLI
jgi:predicted metal-binding membrane protein